MFGAKLAGYYTDDDVDEIEALSLVAGYYTDDDDVKEIEAQLYPVETRFNGKRVRTMDDEDDPAIQTSILAQSIPS
jgi:hypothetical protein